MNESTKLVARSDGASRGNPGPAGIGVVISDSQGHHLARVCRYLGRRTNNEAEYAGVMLALETALGYHPAHLELLLDSELVVRQLEGRYRVRSPQLLPLFERTKALLRQFPSVSIRHVPREQNREADALANQAIDEAASSRVDKH